MPEPSFAVTVTETMSITPHDCVVSTGMRDIAVNGEVNLGLSLSLTNNEPASDIVEQATGKLTWAGGSCDLNYELRLTLQGAFLLSGTVCGEPVDGSVALSRASLIAQ